MNADKSRHLALFIIGHLPERVSGPQVAQVPDAEYPIPDWRLWLVAAAPAFDEAGLLRRRVKNRCLRLYFVVNDEDFY
jgi:hypothetical protein